MEPTLAERVVSVIVETLALPAQHTTLNADSALFGAFPELDSFSILNLIAALETEFGIRFDDEDITAESFETVGTLTSIVQARS